MRTICHSFKYFKWIETRTIECREKSNLKQKTLFIDGALWEIIFYVPTKTMNSRIIKIFVPTGRNGNKCRCLGNITDSAWNHKYLSEKSGLKMNGCLLIPYPIIIRTSNIEKEHQLKHSPQTNCLKYLIRIWNSFSIVE